MIWDTLENLQRYEQALPALAEALRFARTVDSDQPEKKFDLRGEDMYAMVSTYETLPVKITAFEAHRKYADVQMVLQGRERIDVADLTCLEEEEAYNADRDVAFYECHSEYSTLAMTPGLFVLLLPNEAHRPGLQLTGPEPVRKLVIKIRASLLPWST